VFGSGSSQGGNVPTYQYACTACGHRLEAVQSFTDEPLTECPICAGRLRKLYSAVGIVFKGSGFYRTDSRNGNGKKDSDAAKADAAKSDGAKGDGGKTDGAKADGAGTDRVSANGRRKDATVSSGSSSAAPKTG
jgi:putative FmdB family regulatory protein